MDFGDRFIIGLTNDRGNGWIWESFHNLVCGTHSGAGADGAGAVINL